MTRMTKKIAISIPDDVAQRLAAGDIDNVSAYVTQAVRRQMIVEQTRHLLAEVGVSVSEDGVDRWRRIFAERAAERRPGQWTAIDDRIADLPAARSGGAASTLSGGAASAWAEGAEVRP
jgi:hypothetical protein